MRSFVLAALAVGSLCACKRESPAGTVVADWTYVVVTGDPPPVLTPKRPPQTITSNAEWPAADGPPVKLRFETEIGDLADADVHWSWPRHVHITLAEPTKAKLPQVDCMAGPPGNKVVSGTLVRPLGHDGVTPIGLVACFFMAKDNDSYVFNINGDGEVTRSTTKH